MGGFVWKVMGLGSAIMAGIAMKKAIALGWKKGIGGPPPANPTSPDTNWGEAIAFALASGALIGVARMFATRKAAQYFRKSTGHLPPGLEDVS